MSAVGWADEELSDSAIMELDLDGGGDACEAGGVQAPAELSRAEEFGWRVQTVTNFAKLAWCEQSAAYDLSPPLGELAALNEAEKAAGSTAPPKRIVPTSDQPQVKRGAALHLKRELEVQTPVEVETTCREDRAALKLFNLLSGLLRLLAGEGLVRELPLFGFPYGADSGEARLFMSGIVDEVRLEPESWTLTLSELKTRQSSRPPRRAQVRVAELQVAMYARLWARLWDGALSLEEFCEAQKADGAGPLGEAMAKLCRGLLGLPAEAQPTLGTLLGKVRETMGLLPREAGLEVEFVEQATGRRIVRLEAAVGEAEVGRRWRAFGDFWLLPGHRPRGVGDEAEELAKCDFCQYRPVCAWRRTKAREMAHKALQQF